MYLNKLKAFLVLTLVIIFTCSFAILANAEDAASAVSDSSAVSEVSVESNNSATSDTSKADSSVASDVSDASNAVTSEDSNAASSEGEGGSSSNGWVAWAVIGGLIVVLAIGIAIAVLTKSALGEKITKAYRDYKSEIKKVVWLSKKELLKQTTLVITILLISIVFLGLLDFLFTKLLALI